MSETLAWGRKISGDWTVYQGVNPEKGSSASIAMEQVDDIAQKLQEAFTNNGWTVSNMRPSIRVLTHKNAFCHQFVFHKKLRKPLHIYISSELRDKPDISVSMKVSDKRCYDAYAKSVSRLPVVDEMLKAIEEKLDTIDE